jgi:hypothetical protein
MTMPTAANPGSVLDSEFWTIEEVAVHYRTTVATVRYWRYTGYGPKGARTGLRVLYPRAEIERFDQEIASRAAYESEVTRHAR